MKKTAITMLSYNTLTFTKLALYSIRKFAPDVPYELIVMDQGSKDGSAEWIRTLDREKWPELKVITTDYNLMFSKGQNVMRNFASDDCEYLLLLNSDVEARGKGWLEERIRPLEEDDMVGVTGTWGNCHKWDGGGKFFLEDLTEGMTPEERIQFVALYKYKCVEKNDNLREITGWSMATRMRLWDSFNGLRSDGRYKHMWSDTEFSLRAQLAGFKLALQPYRNEQMVHFSGLSHSAIHDKANYDERAQNIIEKVKTYETEFADLHRN